MYTARIVVLTIALSAGGVAAYLASGSDNKTLPTEPVVQLQTVDVLVARSDIGLGQSVTSENLQWQTWPAATASNNFIRRSERPDATNQIAGSIARGTLSPALRSIVDVNMVENETGDRALKRGESINVVRYGVLKATTTQK
jgi:Flp pilus assembly protein CpaB